MHINYTGNRNKLSFNYKGLDYYYHTNPYILITTKWLIYSIYINLLKITISDDDNSIYIE